jgi:serine/threonine-protein kinase
MLRWITTLIKTWRDYPLRNSLLVDDMYRILSQLGEGSFGITYLVSDIQTERRFVLKQNRASKGERAVQMLHYEFTTMGAIQHEYMPRAERLFEWRNRHFLLMEYIEGITLEALIFTEAKTFTTIETVSIARQIVHIISEVHRHGYVHLDVRLPNLIMHKDCVYLLDFGLARRIGDHPDEEPYQSGKLAYRHLAEPQSDLYALGHVMLFMLYTTFSDEQASSNWEEELVLPDELHIILRKLLKLDQPYDSALEVIDALSRVQGE